jgi:hypothetical protein
MKVSWLGAHWSAAPCVGAPGAQLWVKAFGMSLTARVATPSADGLPSDPGPTMRPIQRAGEVAAMAKTRQAYELLLIEEADAWFEYLEATRGQSATRYSELEPWAWARLRQRLRAIKTRRAKLRPAAA